MATKDDGLTSMQIALAERKREARESRRLEKSLRDAGWTPKRRSCSWKDS